MWTNKYQINIESSETSKSVKKALRKISRNYHTLLKAKVDEACQQVREYLDSQVEFQKPGHSYFYANLLEGMVGIVYYIVRPVQKSIILQVNIQTVAEAQEFEKAYPIEKTYIPKMFRSTPTMPNVLPASKPKDEEE